MSGLHPNHPHPPNHPNPRPNAISGALYKPDHSIYPVRDLSLSTITTYIKHENGNSQEISCIGLRDLVIGSSQPQYIDTSYLDRLSFHAWVSSVREDMARETRGKLALSSGWHIYIGLKTGTRLMLVPPNDRGFRAALKRNFDLTRGFVETDVTIMLCRPTSE